MRKIFWSAHVLVASLLLEAGFLFWLFRIDFIYLPPIRDKLRTKIRNFGDHSGKYTPRILGWLVSPFMLTHFSVLPMPLFP
jgi:hypothetical protein